MQVQNEAVQYEAALEQRRREVEAQLQQGEEEQAMRLFQQGMLVDGTLPSTSKGPPSRGLPPPTIQHTKVNQHSR